MKLAAIDIGSNAVRMQISLVIEYQGDIIFKKLEYVRYPLRLGKEVFVDGKVSDRSCDCLVKLMAAYKLLMELYQVSDYMACATSAIREAENREYLKEKVKHETGLEITAIEGVQEAEMMDRVVSTYVAGGFFLHIDVGGGSTELNMYRNKVKVASESFKTGAVRRLNHSDSPDEWNRMEAWIRNYLPEGSRKLTALGTGGSIMKVFGLSGLKHGRKLSKQKMQEVADWLGTMSMEERMYKMQLNPDRADVIVPASEIYLKVMEVAGAQYIMVPDVGLKDGIIHFLYEKNSHRTVPYKSNQGW